MRVFGQPTATGCRSSINECCFVVVAIISFYCYCYYYYYYYKKLRYREEHSASVVLSWCAL